MKRLNPKFSSESDLAKGVIAWLTVQHWDVYQEVELYMGGNRADIVATQGTLVWVVECKLTFGLDVIEQGQHWANYAHFSSVAVPKSRGGRFAELVCKHLRIGVLRVDPRDGAVTEEVSAVINRKAMARYVKAQLRDEHKTWAEAGNAASLRWTPFQQTCLEVRRIARATPGLAMKEVVDQISHHYRTNTTAIACLRKWADAGKIKGVRTEWDGRKTRLYPTEAS